MKTTVTIPDRTFRLAEELARRLGISRGELYRRAIEAYVRARNDDDVTEALNEVYATEDSALEPVIAQLQSASLRKWKGRGG